ncbi:MAG TPA: hypothetical protein VG477_12715, partial [Thermoanaerobaculia bacterium]|nr:hypothetical protein [Thermoanaerobaculia bacterium]
MKTKALMFLGFLALVVSGALAQEPASPPAKGPTFEERLAARAAENRYAVSYKNGAFSGPGWERLVEEGKKSRFFLVGEEHGVAEIPAVV